MARPRVIKLEDGTISLSGFSKEMADALTDHIKSFSQPALAEQTVEAVAPPKVTISEFPTSEVVTTLSHKAIGVIREEGKYHFVTVSYDLASKKAEVASVVNAVSNKEVGNLFRVAAANNNFI